MAASGGAHEPKNWSDSLKAFPSGDSFVAGNSPCCIGCSNEKAESSTPAMFKTTDEM